jgi:cytochrome P450
MHYCLGAPFVRLQARIAFEVLVQRLPDLHLVSTQPLTYLPSLLNRTLQHLHVRWDMPASEIPWGTCASSRDANAAHNLS